MPRQNTLSSRGSSPATKITLIFGTSSSQAYQLAVDTAQSFDTYEKTGGGKSVTHRVTFTLDQIDDLRHMLDLVGRWKSTRLEINGRPVRMKDVSSALHCYAESCRAYNPEEYCHGREDASSYNDNDLGCRHCGVNPYSWQGLTEFGRMLRNGSFAVDKNKLIHTVARNLQSYMICPRLDADKIRKKLESFPGRIDPRVHKDWEYVTDYDGGKEVAIGVRKRDPRRDSGYVLKEDGGPSSSHMTIAIDQNEILDGIKDKQNKKGKKRKGCGCLTLALLALGIITLIGVIAERLQ